MTLYERMITELVCWSNGAEIVDIKENMAIDSKGELIREAHIIAIKKPPLEVIDITISIEPLG